MSTTLFSSDDLIIKGNAYSQETDCMIESVSTPIRTDFILLDFTVRINAKLKNFTIYLATDTDWYPSYWNEWYRIAEVLEWLGYMKMYWEGPWNSATDIMNDWVQKIKRSIT